MWVDEGNKNNIYFHRQTSRNREKNSIWKIKSDAGEILHVQNEIKKEAYIYFQTSLRVRDVSST